MSVDVRNTLITWGESGGSGCVQSTFFGFAVHESHTTVEVRVVCRPHIKNIFQSIAAKVEGGEPCCDWVSRAGTCDDHEPREMAL